MLDQAVKQKRDCKFTTKIKELKKLKEKLDFSESDMKSLNALIQEANKSKLRSAKTKWEPLTALSKHLDDSIERLTRCRNLAREFRVVTLDTSVKRHIARPRVTNENKDIYKTRVELLKNPKKAEEVRLKWEAEENKRLEEERIQRIKDKSLGRVRKRATKKSLMPLNITPVETLSIPLVFSTKLPAKPTVSHSATKNLPNYWQRSFKITASVPTPTAEAMKLIGEHKHKFDWMECWWVPKDLKVEDVTPPPADPILVGAIKTSEETYYFELTRWIDETVEDGWWSKEAY